MPAPDTVTEAVAFLAREGYTEDLRLAPNGLAGMPCGTIHGVDSLIVDYTFRFEGPSDPADEAIVLGVSCPESNAKGVLVSAFGPDADPADAELLAALASRPSRRQDTHS